MFTTKNQVSKSVYNIVRLTFVCCRAHALLKLTIHVYVLYSVPAAGHGRHYLARSPGGGAPTHLLYCLLLVLAVFIVSLVHVWSRSLSFYLFLLLSATTIWSRA